MASRNSMLEKILEDFPNCNNQSLNQVKNETSNRDFDDLFSSPSFLDSFNHSKSYNYSHHSQAASQMNQFTTATNSATSLNNRINSHLNLPNTTSFFNNDQSHSSNLFGNRSNSIDRNKMNNLNLQLNKSQNHSNSEIVEPIDLNSSKGKFGWSACTIFGNEVPLPIILRKDEKLVPVRIVESKIIGLYSNDLPWDVFSCINIKSFFITDIEAKLLNEINTLHCDNYYGSNRFTSKDVVVRLNDVQTLQTFLETSKKVFIQGLDRCDFLGFVQISGIASVIPYIIKETRSSNQGISQSKSSITSSLSNLSIKKPIVESNDQSSPLMLSNELKELKNDDLNCFLNANDNPGSIKIDSSSDTTFNENSLPDLEENVENNFDQNFNNQVTSSDCVDHNSLDQEFDQQIDSNFINSIGDLDPNLNSFETDQFDDVLQCEANYQTSNEMDTSQSKKFVPCSLIDDMSFVDKAEKMELSEWDCSYLKMICIYAGYDNLTKSLTLLSKLLADASNNGTLMNCNSLKLVCLNDLKCDAVHFKPVTVKECQVNSSFGQSATHQFNQAITNQPHQHSVTNNYLTASNVQSTTNLNHNNNHHKKSHHSTTHQTHLHPHSKKLNLNNNNHQSTKEAHSLAYLDDLFHKISPTNSFVNNNLIDQTSSNSNNALHLGCSASNLTDNNLNSNNNIYHSTSNYQFNRSHVNDNYNTNHIRLNSHQQSLCHPSATGSLTTANKSNYHLTNKGGNYGTSSLVSNQSNKTNHLFGTSFIDELAKKFQPNGTTNNLNSLNSVNSSMNNRNVQNSYNFNTTNQSSIATQSSNFNFDNVTNNNLSNSLVNNSGLASNRISNLSSMINLGLSNSFHNSFQSTTGHDSSLYAVSNVILDNVQLKSINLKPSTPLQALLLSEVNQKLFNDFDMVTLKFLLDSTFKLKLHDCSSLHKHAFNSHGLYPSQDDKLILFDDLKKFLPQIRQCIANLMNLMPKG